MLQAINDRIKGWLGAAIVIVIGLPFAFWGIQSYMTGGKELYAAKVNDVEISQRELDFNVTQQRQKLREQLGGKIPFDDDFIKKQVLDQLINKKLVESVTYEAGYRVSDAELSASIVRIFSDNGAFNRDLFERTLQARGQSPQQFENELRNDIRVTQMRAALMNTSLVTDDEIRKLIALEDQGREASLLKFNLNDYQATVSYTEEDIQTAYQTQSEKYMLPEKVSVEYVELKNDQLATDVEIDQQQLKQMYEDYVAEVSGREKRKSSHILIKSDENKDAARQKLEDIRQQLLAGASFEELAKQQSQDPGSAKQGGDLGWVESGQMVKPFEDALFALSNGEVSGIVESEFGFHLIKLDGIESEAADSFEVKRVELEQILRQEALGNVFYDLSETLATTAYENPDSLAAVSDSMNLPIQNSELFTRQSGAGIAGNEAVRKAAFANAVLQDGANSDIIELAPDHVVVLRILEHKPASLRPLEEVRPVIENALRRQKGQQLALDAAQAAKARIEAGESIEALVAGGQVLDRPGVLKRSDTGKADPQVLEALFKLPPAEAGKTSVTEVATFTGDVMLVVLDKIITPEKIEQSRIDSMKAQLRRDVASQEFNAALLSLRQSADIYLNQSLTQK